MPSIEGQSSLHWAVFKPINMLLFCFMPGLVYYGNYQYYECKEFYNILLNGRVCGNWQWIIVRCQ